MSTAQWQVGKAMSKTEIGSAICNSVLASEINVNLQLMGTSASPKYEDGGMTGVKKQPVEVWGSRKTGS